MTRKKLSIFMFTLAVLIAGGRAEAGVSAIAKQVGERLFYTDWNALRGDVIAGCFYDSSGTGSNSVCVTHNGTDGRVLVNTGHLRLGAPTGKEIQLEVNATDVVNVAAGSVTVAQPFTAQGSLGVTGSVFVSGGANITGAVTTGSTLDIAGAGTFRSTTAHTGASTFASTIAVTGAANLSGAANITGAVTTGSTLDVAGATTLRSTLAVTSTANLSGAANITGAVETGSTLRSAGVITGIAGVAFSNGGNVLSSYTSAGTFTPAFAYATVGSSSWTFSVQQGFYEKIGTMVHVHGRITWTAHSVGTGSGALNLTGLPFTSTNTTHKNSVSVPSVAGITPPAGGLNHTMWVVPNVTYCEFYSSTLSSASSTATQWQVSNITVGSAGFIAFDFWYTTAS